MWTRQRLPELGARAALAGLGVILALVPAAAAAHAGLLSSDPAPGLVLQQAPEQLVLSFSERVTPVGSGIEVIAPSGRRVPVERAVSTGSTLSARLHPVEPGTYLVTWRVVSEDAHPSRGQFTFSVGQAGPPPTAPLGADLGAVSPAGLLLQVLARWVHFAGLALTLGALVLMLLTPPAEGSLRRLAGAGVAVLVVAEPLALLAAGVGLGGLDPGVAGDLLGSGFGRLLGLRLGCVIAIWMVMGAVGTAGRGRPLVLVPALALLLVDGGAAHLVLGGRPGAVALNAVHEGAMAVWAGGLTGILALRLPLLKRFAPIAVTCLVTLVVSGAFLALSHLRAPADLLFSGYGLVLAAKIGLGAVVILVAWRGARRLEAVGIAGMAALAGILLSVPPPR